MSWTKITTTSCEQQQGTWRGPVSFAKTFLGKSVPLAPSACAPTTSVLQETGQTQLKLVVTGSLDFPIIGIRTNIFRI